MEGKYVAYYRVSTKKQGRSGLGLEAQREAVQRFLNGGRWQLVGQYQDVETGKGSNALDRRPGLRDAVAAAKKQRATLVIARLDRLARNVHFVSGLMETGVQFRCCDFPTADRTMLHIYAAMAEHEGRRISDNIRRALAVKRTELAKKGKKLGNVRTLQPLNRVRSKEARRFASKLRPTVTAWQAAGYSQRKMVDELNALGITTPRGGEWSLVQLQRAMARM